MGLLQTKVLSLTMGISPTTGPLLTKGVPALLLKISGSVTECHICNSDHSCLLILAFMQWTECMMINYLPARSINIMFPTYRNFYVKHYFYHLSDVSSISHHLTLRIYFCCYYLCFGCCPYYKTKQTDPLKRQTRINLVMHIHQDLFRFFAWHSMGLFM